VLYENQKDREVERVLADVVQSAWRCQLKKLNPTSPVDYCAMRGRDVVAWVEIKRRSKTMAEISELGGVMVNLEKVIACQNISTLTNKPWFLVIGARDGVYAAKISEQPEPDAVTFCGRKDRGDPNDVEACAIYKAPRFKLICA
jgi:hypothetical protein